MPRNSTDEGDAGLEGNPERRFSSLTGGKDAYYDDPSWEEGEDDEDLELIELERRLNEEVDEDFFTEPKRFNTIHRVIDVLGLQMIDDATIQSAHNELAKNPAYKTLKAQQQIVEGAIEHMAVIHCADLNGSVIQVGKVARQFSEAVSKVRSLRKQVRDIQDTLGAASATATAEAASNMNNKNAPAANASEQRPQNAAAMSLRELWLKKLECEATLGLLDRLDVIRAAPSRFDFYVSQTPCRIGAAVLQVSKALQTMFSDDVAQVQALHKIMEQLMIRKQKAEEILWDTLGDIVYLRTGNGLGSASETVAAPVNFRSSGTVTSASSVTSLHKTFGKKKKNQYVNGIYNPFAARGLDIEDANAGENGDDKSVNSNGSGASLFSHDSDDEDDVEALETGSTTSILRRKTGKAMMIPIPQLDVEIDLEADERRCMEEMALSGALASAPTSRQRQPVPRYADPVMALRIVVECLARLKRLDDVERVLLERMEAEMTTIRQRQQARTFALLEERRKPQSIRSAGKAQDLTDFRRHLTRLLAAFGCVYLRLGHLAQILRWRISSDKELLQTVESPSSIMRSVLTSASNIMQREIRAFLQATLHETELPQSSLDSSVQNVGYDESGLFSLGIVETAPKQPEVATATRSNVMEMSTTKFVSSVLFPKTKSTPQVRHALTFRRSLARWSSTLDSAKRELATLTGEDVTAPSFNTVTDESVIEYLDKVIQNDLLPVLQEEAVNGTVQGLERRDAFDPVLDRSLYARPGTNEPQDVDMCMACQAMYQFTGPLFMALHRLPRDGDMYLPLVAVLEHVVLTFISRVKQQVGSICNGKTALNLLMQEASEATSFSSVCERRRPFRQLLQAYGSGDALDSSSSEQMGQQSGVTPLAPSPSDTARRASSEDLKGMQTVEEFADGIEGEEAVMQFELSFLKPYLDFSSENKRITVASDEELMRAACLGHSLLKLAGLLENRLMIRSSSLKSRALTSTRALREAIKTIRSHGMKMAKFCRLDMLMQTLQRLSRVSRSSTLVALDAVRIPSSVNDLGEYLTAASDNLREAAGNAVTAYAFSSLEQYIPYFLMQTVRVVAQGKGIITKSPLTLNGVEALDRSGSVLYRDLKGATSFDNSFWDVELAAASFEQSAGFMAMLEFDMEELVAYYAANREDFSEADFELMFSMTGPRRRGDVGRYHMVKRQLR